MKIYDASNNLLLDVVVDDNSYRYRAIMGDHNLTLYFALAEHVELPVGAWCEFQAQKYYLMRPQSLKMRHTRYFEYTAVFESSEWRASTWKFRCIYTDEKKAELTDGRVEFSLTATAQEFLQMVVDNLNYRDSGWSIGECVDDGTKTLSFSHNNILEALQMIADEFNTEYEFNADKVVSLHKLSYYKSVPLSLSYGKGNGIKPNVQRSNTNDTMPVERLWVQGGEDNIDKSKYGSKTLHLPKGGTLSYDGEHFEGEKGYDSASARTYAADANGESISRSDKAMSTYAEDSLDCTDIYPKRVGTISSVVVRNEDKNWYDVYDNSIPDALDYNDCKIGDDNMTIIFQTGMLAGKEFDINKYVHGESASGRYFEVTPQEIDGVTMPGGVYIPAVGDTYAIFNCTLPDSYISDSATKTGAEWDMFREAIKYMYENEDEKYTISASLDGIWAKKDWVNIGGRIRLGSYIKFSDERFFPDGVLVRITGVKDYVNRPHSPEIELSNDVTAASFTSTMKKLETTPVLIEESRRKTMQYTKRSFRDALDTTEGLINAGLSKFTDGISPVTVRTMQLLVGDESLQYRFVNSKTYPTQIDDSMEYDSTTKQLSSSASIIQHMTLGITEVSNVHSVSDYKFWDVSSYISAVLDDGTKRYYIYIKALKTGTTAEFYLSERPIDIDGNYTDDEDGSVSTKYYYFLFAILNKENEGTRNIARLYGYTEVLPGRVTTDKIVSSDGKTYFDLVNSVIGGTIRFVSTSGEEKNVNALESDISTVKEAAKEANDRLANWKSDSYISPTEKLALKEMQAQIEDDYPEVVDRCDKYGVSYTSFTSAYNAAIKALTKYISSDTENIPVEGDYDNIAAYWEAKKTVLLSINSTLGDTLSDLRKDVDSAATAAKNASDEAAAAKTEIANWADDSIVTPVEKRSLSKMLTQIQEDYAEIVDRCTEYSVDYSDFTAAYSNALKSLNYYTKNPTETTAIDNANYPYYYISDYWDARTVILKTLNDTVSGKFTSIQKDIKAANDEATKATETLSSWASDKKISPTEKLALKEMLKEIQQDYPEVIDRCKEYSVSYTSFTSAYNAAIAALGVYTATDTWSQTLDVGSDYDDIAKYWEAKKAVLLEITQALTGSLAGLRTDVDDAKSAAASAAQKAQAAQDELTSWSDDGNVTPVEKRSLKQMKEQIEKDYTEIIDRCDKYDITDYSAFTTAYNNAISSLNYYTADSEQTTVIDNVNHPYSYIAAYWDARTTILKTVNKTLKDYSDGIVSKATDDLTKAYQAGDAAAIADAEGKIETLGDVIVKGGIIESVVEKTLLVQAAKAVQVGTAGGQRIDILADNKSIQIFDASGNKVQELEGGSYTSLGSLFGTSNGDMTISSSSGLFNTLPTLTGQESAEDNLEQTLTNVKQTTTPTEFTLKAGTIYAYAKSGSVPSTIGIQANVGASASIRLAIRTYSDEACTDLLETVTLGEVAVASIYYADEGAKSKSDYGYCSGMSARVCAGWHKLVALGTIAACGAGSTAYVRWGYSTSLSTLKYSSEFYVSRFFANGFCLGTRTDNYIWAYNQGASLGMRFVMENNGYGIDVSQNGIQVKHHSGNWMSLPLFIAKFRVTVVSSGATMTSHYTWNGVALSDANVSRSGTGTVKITYPTTTEWTGLGLNTTNQIINAVGYKSSTEYSKPTIYGISSTGFTLYLSDDNSLNDNMAADITIYKIS